MQRLQPKPLTRQWPITLLSWVTPTYTVFLPTLPPPFSPSPIRLSLSFFRRCGIAIVLVDEVKVFCKGGRLCSLTTSNETVHGWINRHAYARGCDRVNATPTLARRFKLCPCPDSALRTPPHSDGLGLAINVSLYAWILSLPCPYHQLHFHFCVWMPLGSLVLHEGFESTWFCQGRWFCIQAHFLPIFHFVPHSPFQVWLLLPHLLFLLIFCMSTHSSHCFFEK